ncbi:hypothetical protein LOY54_17380 [Pseudomonas sp. B21-032]|uniref:hypothetical protein n=1 Tax=Pseudomonas sp. B21-032 TaxID=2895483 RepID=UPI002160A0D4|nr:hypothetical protein [Pseudomonas sp. B21-032]UVL59812.1 hypothetical protein LOY54_17380 [Pseudomonas sp. B21-032]
MTDQLKHSKANLTAAQQAVDAMLEARSFEQYESDWRDFLGHIEKAWIKVERACIPIQASFQPWQGKYQALRRKDMLLRYLKAARDADTHSIQDLTKIEPGGRGLNFVNPRGGRIESLEIGANGEILQYRGDPIHVIEIPPRPVALPVKNNGQWYNPPASHLGNPISDKHPTILARMGLQFYQEFIAEVERTFFSK